MDQRKQQLQSIGICNKLYNFMKFLATHPLKILTSGSLMPRRLPQAPESNAAKSRDSSKGGGQTVHPMAEETNQQDKDVPSTSAAATNTEEKRRLEEATSFASDADEVQSKAPKKMVSINENVQTFSLTKKKSKKKEKKEKEEQEEEPKPLKSILKVGSNVNNSFLDRASGA